MDPRAMVIVFLFASVVGAAVYVVRTMRRRTRIARRLRGMDRLVAEPDTEVPVAQARTGKWEEEESRNAFAALLDNRYPLAGGRRTALAMGVAAVASGLVLVLALGFVGVPFVVAVLAGTMLAAGFAWQVGDFLESRQRRAFTDRLLVAIEEFQRMVRFGMATGEAFNAMAEGAEAPAQASLKQVSLDVGLGVPMAAALDREAKRVRISEMAMLAAIFATQAGTGGGLAESVGNLAAMLRERIESRARTAAATSESKVSLFILSGVPFAAVGIQAASQPELLGTLLGEARYLLGIGVGLIVAGLAVAWFLVRSVQR